METKLVLINKIEPLNKIFKALLNKEKMPLSDCHRIVIL